MPFFEDAKEAAAEMKQEERLTTRHTPKQFVGNYRTNCRHAGALSKHLAAAWLTVANGLPTAQQAHVAQSIHHVQPRRKSVYLALLVYREIMLIDHMAARAFLEVMEFKDNRRTYGKK